MIQTLKAWMAFVLVLWIAGCVPDPAGTSAITGRITDDSGAALSGVGVALTGDAAGAVVTDANGNYTFADLADGNYTLRPTKVGYAFNPVRQSVTVAAADASGVNFVGSSTSTIPAGSFTISGTVTDDTGAPLADVSVSATLGGTSVATVTSGADGQFVINGLANGEYTLTPSRAGYTFQPTSSVVAISGASKPGVTFTGKATVVTPPPQFSISGRVVNDAAQGVAGVTITLSNGMTTATTVTPANGNYSFTGLAPGDYSLTPTLNGSIFEPTSKSVTVSTANISGIDFTARSATATTYTVSGTVKLSSGAGIASVTVNLKSGTATVGGAMTNTSGAFTFAGVPNGNYSVVPALAGYTFSPATLPANVNGANLANINFTGAPPTYSISGKVTTGANNAGLAGVTVALSGAATANVTTDASGVFSFANLTAGDYVLKPSLTDYTFTPTSANVTNLSSDITGIVFSAAVVTAPTYTVSGKIATSSGSAVTGVSVALTGGATPLTTTTNASGVYTFAAVAAGNYTATPTLAGYTFSPATKAVNVTNANVASVDFTATPPMFSVSGKVATSSGAAVAGVSIALTGGASPLTATTDTSGIYTFASVGAGNYTATPALAGYTFSPAAKAVNVTNANVASVDFTATPPTYTVSGKVATSSGAAVAGVSIALTGGASPLTATTDTSGTYTFASVAAGNYTATPTLTGYTFGPATKAVNVTNANVASVDFTATPPTYTVSGKIATSTGAAISGVTVVLSGTPTKSVTTDTSGLYSIAGVAAGSYTVTPALTGYTFTPANKSVSVATANVANVDFQGAPPVATTYSLSGAITTGGAGLNGVTVSLSGGSSASTTTNSSGAYAISGLASGSYTVTPSLSGYSFTPTSKTVSISAANATAVDFAAAISGTTTRNYTLYIVAGTLTITGGGGAAIPAWSYTDTAATAKFPGPLLTANEGDTVNITVINNHTIEHNLLVQGISDGADPSMIAPGASKTYSFVAGTAGTYLYYDSRNSNINREMGMYGALVVAPPDGGNNAWPGGPSFSFQRTWIASDIDKPLWNDVASAGGTVNTANYKPNYFVLNGMGGRAAMDDKINTAIDGKVGQSALVRIVNAGQYPQTFHFHANHVKVLSVNNVRRTAPYKLLDVVSVPPLGVMEVLFELNQPGNYPMHNHTAQMETANGTYLNGVGTAIYIAP